MIMPLKKSVFSLGVMVLLTLMSCAPMPVQKTDVVTVSKSETRQYRSIVLDNGLKVILVSDANTDYSAASLDVFVGSSSDPKNRQGLAHFLEHMLFLGTKKYPKSDEYMQFLEDNGGSNNAFTSYEHTNYFFDVKPSALEPTLDRFAQFFISPLLDASYVAREKHAVNSEYRAGIKDESRRFLDVLREVMNQDHSFSDFSVGSLATLSSEKAPIQHDLQLFFNRYYAANNMALSVLGKEPLDQLELMVREKFASVKAKGEVTPVIKADFFNSNMMGKMVLVQPEKSIHSLTLLFPLPDQIKQYKSKPMDLIAYVLGDEGEGSLLAYLKANNLASGVSTSTAFTYKGGTVLAVSVTLTDHGDKEREAVLLAVFQTIERLRNHDWSERLFKEMAAVNQLTFDYGEAKSAQQEVMNLSGNLQYFPSSDVLSADFLMTEYRPRLIDDLVSRLTLKNCVIFSVSKNFKADKTSMYYQTPYAVTALPARWINDIASLKLNENIRLPVVNAFLPENLSVLAVKNQQVNPEKIVDKPGVQLWYKGVDKFALPKASTYFSFKKTGIRDTLNKAVLLDVYIALINDDLATWLYPAQMSGMSLELYTQLRGVTLKVNGFNDKQKELLSQVLERIKKSQLTEAQFLRVKAELIKNLENADKTQPYRKLEMTWFERLQSPSYSTQLKLAELRRLQLKDINQFSQHFWQDMQITGLVSGNVSKRNAIAMLDTVTEAIDSPQNADVPIKVLKLNRVNQFEVVAVDHKDAAYALYWQAKRNDMDAQAKYMLLAKALESPFFSDIRTQQQLGYVVYARYANLISVPGIMFVVQSPTASVEKIHHSVQGFILGAKDGLVQMKPEYFQQLQQALQQELLAKPLSLAEESERYWYNIAMGYTELDREQQLAQAINDLSIDDWRSFITRLYREPFTRMLLLSTATQPLENFNSREPVNTPKQYFDFP